MLEVDVVECPQVIVDKPDDVFTGLGLVIPGGEVDLDGRYPSGVFKGATVATRLIVTTETLATLRPGIHHIVDEILCLDGVVSLDRPLETGSDLPVDLLYRQVVRLITILVEYGYTIDVRIGGDVDDLIRIASATVDDGVHPTGSIRFHERDVADRTLYGRHRTH